jgi:hypothetical protein
MHQNPNNQYVIVNGVARPVGFMKQALGNQSQERVEYLQSGYIENVAPEMPRTIWQPFANSSQQRFIECNSRFILYGGTRGPGKTDAALMKFAMHVGKGYGAAWRGLVLSTRFKNLDDVVSKGKKWFYQMPNKPTFLRSASQYKFVWPTGEELLLRIAEKDDDYYNYHGHEYPFILFEELTKWTSNNLYFAFQSVNRAPIPNMPRFYIATTNPYGPGHHWVKELWVDPNPKLSTIGSLLPAFGEGMETRVRFDGDIMENEFLKKHDPEYILMLDNLPNEELRKAWRYGNWDINVGAFFHGYLTAEHNMVKPFMPPASWRRWKAYDWGSRRPYSLGYYAQDDEGIIYRYREVYGWNGKPNEGNGMIISDQCKVMDEIERFEKRSKLEFVNNPADDSMWNSDGRVKNMAQEFASRGHIWQRARKSMVMRINRWQLCKELFQTGSVKITSDCVHFWRTIPNLMADENKWEDIDSDGEDHVADEFGYSVTSRHMASLLKNKGFPGREKPDTSKLGGQPYAHLILPNKEENDGQLH